MVRNTRKRFIENRRLCRISRSVWSEIISSCNVVLRKAVQINCSRQLVSEHENGAGSSSKAQSLRTQIALPAEFSLRRSLAERLPYFTKVSQ